MFKDWTTEAVKEPNTKDHLTYTNPRKKDLRSIHKGFGQVTPIVINQGGVRAQGFGRFYTIREFAVVVGCCAEGGVPRRRLPASQSRHDEIPSGLDRSSLRDRIQ